MSNEEDDINFLLEHLIEEAIEENLANFFLNKAKSELGSFASQAKKNKLFKHFRIKKPFFNKKFYDLSGQDTDNSFYRFFLKKPKQRKIIPGQNVMNLSKQETSLLNVLKSVSYNSTAKKILNKQQVTKAELYNLSKWLLQTGKVTGKSIQDLNLSLGGVIYHILSPR